MTTIGIYTRFVNQKTKEIRTFYVFDDGSVREMTKGFGTLYSNCIKLFNSLKLEGYKEQYN